MLLRPLKQESPQLDYKIQMSNIFSMLFLCLLITNLIIATAGVDSISQSNGGEYCDKELATCDKKPSHSNEIRLIFYDVNPSEGFNLRRDVYMRFAIMVSEARKKGNNNWNLVLPPWHNLYHWKIDRAFPKPWSIFFDIESLRSFSPVLELREVFTKLKNNALEIDTLYVLKNFEDAFENGVFEEKWQTLSKCNYNAKFWGYKNVTAKEVVCVEFQGKISQLWELISLHLTDKKIMFAHGEIPLHVNYGTKTYWDCRKSMKFNKNLIKIAKEYMGEFLDCTIEKCQNYLSVHWRRQDFARSRGNDVPTIGGTARQIHKILKKMSAIKKVFIATDASMDELSNLEQQLNIYGYESHFFLPSNDILEEYGDGGIAIIDQIICSHAAYFVGTHESTFTYRIQEEREILNFKSDTTFNRLCPDIGPCERPSKWTIVN